VELHYLTQSVKLFLRRSLAFKKKRNIINPSYQSQADNIVGKMTIAALDREIFDKEKPRTGDVCSLGAEQVQGRNVTRGVS
jgi:hypothetical protein